MEAGKLRNRITLQQEVGETKRTSGQPIESWVDRFDRWARVTALSGREWQQAQKVNAEVTHKVVVRSDSETRDIGPSWRVKYRERIYEILSLLPDEKNIQIDLLCKEIVNG